MTKKKSFVPSAVKIFIALASFAGTIGIWNGFAGKALANNNLEPAQYKPDLSGLPPIPTLIPLVKVEFSPPSTPGAAPVLRSVEAPVVTSPAQTSGPVVVIPKPVTRTKSS